ncbi:hypothetical protein [Mesorhizobium sp.]|uniref:hypothetical protein n=1 Tax=Mesorhizobium sp. TaxID=1871066 RepID=UPI0025803F29|nr:hypothetical protein [Mesorhizobium sp.]
MLREVLQEAYIASMGSKIGMKANVSWVEENISAEAHELHDLGVYLHEDSISNHSDGWRGVGDIGTHSYRDD